MAKKELLVIDYDKTRKYWFLYKLISLRNLCSINNTNAPAYFDLSGCNLKHNFNYTYHQIVTIHISKNRNDLKKRNNLKTSDNFQG